MTTTLCPYCGVVLRVHHEAVGNPGAPERPLAGTVSGCVECGSVAIWEDSAIGLTLRKLTPEESVIVTRDPDYRAFVVRLAAARFPRQRGEAT